MWNPYIFGGFEMCGFHQNCIFKKEKKYLGGIIPRNKDQIFVDILFQGLADMYKKCPTKYRISWNKQFI